MVPCERSPYGHADCIAVASVPYIQYCIHKQIYICINLLHHSAQHYILLCEMLFHFVFHWGNRQRKYIINHKTETRELCEYLKKMYVCMNDRVF